MNNILGIGVVFEVFYKCSPFVKWPEKSVSIFYRLNRLKYPLIIRILQTLFADNLCLFLVLMKC